MSKTARRIQRRNLFETRKLTEWFAGKEELAYFEELAEDQSQVFEDSADYGVVLNQSQLNTARNNLMELMKLHGYVGKTLSKGQTLTTLFIPFERDGAVYSGSVLEVLYYKISRQASFSLLNSSLKGRGEFHMLSITITRKNISPSEAKRLYNLRIEGTGSGMIDPFVIEETNPIKENTNMRMMKKPETKKEEGTKPAPAAPAPATKKTERKIFVGRLIAQESVQVTMDFQIPGTDILAEKGDTIHILREEKTEPQKLADDIITELNAAFADSAVKFELNEIQAGDVTDNKFMFTMSFKAGMKEDPMISTTFHPVNLNQTALDAIKQIMLKYFTDFGTNEQGNVFWGSKTEDVTPEATA